MTKANSTLEILLPLALRHGYDYLPPPDILMPIRGQIVEVPLGRRREWGVVWGQGQGDVDPAKLKTIHAIADLPVLPVPLCQFIDWVADYTLAPRGMVLKMVFGTKAHLRTKKARKVFSAPRLKPDHITPTLNSAQQKATDALLALQRQQKFTVSLLDGVTGSGKTEVYMEAIAETLRRGEQALVLFPEIAMTTALVERFTARFGAKPILWHSDIGAAERYAAWHQILSGEASLIIGARSALFLPMPKLGLIVVDEEHEASYKQDESVTYHARDMAIVRAHLQKCQIILASATPSLETMINCQNGKYNHLQLPFRFGTATLPEIKLLDLRDKKMRATEFLSPELRANLIKTHAVGQQAMLFLNRRGYAPLTLCRHCGHRMRCQSCNSWLTLHQSKNKFLCHHCGYHEPAVTTCPACKQEGYMAASGPGVERLCEEVQSFMPAARLAMMTSDSMASPKAAKDLLEKMTAGDIDILIGTQMMAKGFHFPNLAFVGVVDADFALGGGDPRAAERMFQLLQQVSGRAGRAHIEGSVAIQTCQPQHKVMQALAKGDRDMFYAAELEERKQYRLPPFARLAALILSGADEVAVEKAARKIIAKAPKIEGLEILGPAPAPLSFRRGLHRWRILVISEKPLSSILQNWLSACPRPRQIDLHIDIDPYSFY
jgi:primosomal protein N' (replication factor Y) (superfamily II helicase)